MKERNARAAGVLRSGRLSAAAVGLALVAGAGCAEDSRDVRILEGGLHVGPEVPWDFVVPRHLAQESGERATVTEATLCLTRFEVQGSAHVLAAGPAARGAAVAEDLSSPQEAAGPAARGAAVASQLLGLLGTSRAWAHPGHDHDLESTVAGGFMAQVHVDLAEGAPLAFRTAAVRARFVEIELCTAPGAALTMTVERGDGEAVAIEVVTDEAIVVENLRFDEELTAGPVDISLSADLRQLLNDDARAFLEDPGTWTVRLLGR